MTLNLVINAGARAIAGTVRNRNTVTCYFLHFHGHFLSYNKEF